jgi:hypothetical protein
MARYEIIDHGWDNSQYFQGCGTAYTPYDHVVTGVGTNAKEAYNDAVEQLYMTEDSVAVARLHLPTRPYGIRAKDKVPACANDECYWYVSIRYTL